MINSPNIKIEDLDINFSGLPFFPTETVPFNPSPLYTRTSSVLWILYLLNSFHNIA